MFFHFYFYDLCNFVNITDEMNDDDTTRRSLQNSFEHVLTTGHYSCLTSKHLEFVTLKRPNICQQTNEIYKRFKNI